MTTRTFSADWLDSEYISVNVPNKLVVHREFVESQEYGSVWTAVFLCDGKYWEVTYQEPFGEAHADTWFDEEDVTATQVSPAPKFVTEWVPVTRNRAGLCKESAGRLGLCGVEAPFLIAVRRDGVLNALERCVEHGRALITSPDEFDKIEEVRRRW